MMLFFQWYTTLLRLSVIGIFGIVNVNMQRATVTHRDSSDVIESTKYPNTTSNDVGWTIEVATNNQILLQFLDFSLNETDLCDVDIFELHDGRRSENVTMLRWCWDDFNELTHTTYISSSNVFFLRLITPDGYSRRGFKAQYTSINLQNSNSSGEIESPEYPYTSNVDMAWRIKVNEGHRIQLQFLDFGIFEKSSCDFDYFELYESQRNTMIVNLRLVGRWCWDTFEDLKRTTYISNNNEFYLRLRTMQGFNRTGFKTNYSSIPLETTTTIEIHKETTLPGLTTFTNESGTIPSSKAIRESATTESTEKLMTDQVTSFLGYIIGVPVVVLFIFCIFLGCCYYCIKSKRKGKDSDIFADDNELQKLPPIQPLEKDASSFMDLMPDISGKDDRTTFGNEGYVASAPTYALPNKKNHVEESNNVTVLQESHDKDEQQKDNRTVLQPSNIYYSNDTTDPAYHDVLEEQRIDKTRNGIKCEKQSNSLELEDAPNPGEIKNDYTYIDISSVKTKRKQFDHVGEATYSDVNESLPPAEKLESDKLVPDVAYASIDRKDESESEIEVDGVLYSLPDKMKRDSMEMVTNEAYQSFDSGEENTSDVGRESIYFSAD